MPDPLTTTSQPDTGSCMRSLTVDDGVGASVDVGDGILLPTTVGNASKSSFICRSATGVVAGASEPAELRLAGAVGGSSKMKPWVVTGAGPLDALTEGPSFIFTDTVGPLDVLASRVFGYS